MEEDTSIQEPPASMNDAEVVVSPSQMLQNIRELLMADSLAAEFKMAVFSAAAMSYRKDFCVRPFPNFMKDSEDLSRLDTLESTLLKTPALDTFIGEAIDNEKLNNDDCTRLLHWIIQERTYSVKTCGKEMLSKLQALTGVASFSLVPDHMFEIEYRSPASARFSERALQYGVKYGYHGSRMDNFHSIINNGLQVHMTKNNLFGEGVYLAEDLAVTSPYVSSGSVWSHSQLGTMMSCIAVCEVLDHPNVKCQVGGSSANRRRAAGTELGDVPEKYFVVTSSDLMRVKYIMLFIDKKQKKRVMSDWLISRYPVATLLGLYVLFLLVMGLWKTRPVQHFIHKHSLSRYFDDD